MELKQRRKDVIDTIKSIHGLPTSTKVSIQSGFAEIILTPQEVGEAIRELYNLPDTTNVTIDFEDAETEIRLNKKKGVQKYTSSGSLHCNRGTRWPEDDDTSPLEMCTSKDYIYLEQEEE